MQLLKDKRALVTGGTSGIGRQIAIAFAQEGADVAIFGTDSERAAQVLQQLEQHRVTAQQRFLAQCVNVTDRVAVEGGVNQVLGPFGGVDILVNNAGIARDGLLMRMSEEDWDAVIDTNLKSVYYLCRALMRPMLKAKAGKIINISSIIGLTGNSGQVNYAASKSGMIGFTKALAQELSSRNICVNCIAPGFIRTRMTERLQQEGELLKRIPLGRIGEPQDVAHVALFLASHMSDYMTGQVLTVDGGMVM